MTPALERQASDAIAAIDAVLRDGSGVEHATIQKGSVAVVALRNAAIAEFRNGTLDRGFLDRTNSLASLAYGAEFPLSGLHLRRMEQTRDGLSALIKDHRGAEPEGAGRRES